jgi:hypothetical protein
LIRSTALNEALSDLGKMVLANAIAAGLTLDNIGD